jgi:hypothetical protein
VTYRPQSDASGFAAVRLRKGKIFFGEWLANLADLKAHLGVISSVLHRHIAVCIESALLSLR